MLSSQLIRLSCHCLCNLLHTCTVAHSEFPLDCTYSCLCVQLRIYSWAGVRIHGWHLVDRSSMASMYWFCHSVPIPIHPHLECGELCRGTVSRWKLQQAVHVLYAGTRHAGLVGYVQVPLGHEWTLVSVLHWQCLNCTFFWTSTQSNVLDGACAASQDWY